MSLAACLEAQEALEAAYLACGFSQGLDIGCDAYKETELDCRDYFAHVAQTAACSEAGTVSWEYGPPCEPSGQGESG